MGQQNPDWTILPKEILGRIFRSLPRVDKLAFTLVCPQWENLADSPIFWKKLTVKLNLDFLDPSLIFLTQKYCKYIQVLEIGWARLPSYKSREFFIRHNEIVKRAGRFLIILYEHRIQIKHLAIINWYDIHPFKKLCYLLFRVIKNQHCLETITLSNAHFKDLTFVNILITCLQARGTVKNIELHYTTYKSRKLFDSWLFGHCIQTFNHLEVLTLDCWIFLQFFSKLQVRICKLREVNLYLDKSLRRFDHLTSIRETQWEMFFAHLPRVIMNLKMERPIQDYQFKNIMKKHYPLVSFTWNYSYYRETCIMDCSQCLERLANLQYKTLEYVCLNLPLQQWHLQDRINYIKKKCCNIKSFLFNGVELIQTTGTAARFGSLD